MTENENKLRQPEARPRRMIARLLGLGFGSVSLVAVIMGLLLLGVINDVSGLVHGMRHDETSIRQGFELATAVREQSVHVAHSLIDIQHSHQKHYEIWRSKIRFLIQELATEIPKSERWRLEKLGENTQRMHDLYMLSALPAARRGDLREVQVIHRELEKLGKSAARHADVLARSVESQMSHAHSLATHSTHLGLWAGGIGAFLVVALSIGFTLRIRQAILTPLKALTLAAQRIGEGNFSPNLVTPGAGELAALSRAFHTMSLELASREALLVKGERMAAIGELAAGVAHELNNPIGIIRGYLRTIEPEGDIETLKDELRILDEEAAQCQRIAEDLLTYSRSGELEFAPIAMGEFIKSCVDRLQNTSNSQCISIETSAQEETLKGDTTRLRQVLFNLLNNAQEASPPHGIVTLRGYLTKGFYVIEVEDQGKGIGEAERAKIFEPFFTCRPGGTGLGLSVVHGIVIAHHGKIEACSSPQGGALFRVSLPMPASHSPA